MGSGSCGRCGRAGEVEYGSDGQAYCSSCLFYGMNKQCWRCRMYLPASELQQYRGQSVCPYCIQDMRDADRRGEEAEAEKAKPRMEALALPEQCDRCGRDLDGRVFIWNGRKLCRSCVSDEQGKWGLVGGGPMGAPYRVSLGPEKRRKDASILEGIVSEIMYLLRIKKRPKDVEIVVVGDKIPIALAKPMAEKARAGDKEKRKPEAEGIILETREDERAKEALRKKTAVPIKTDAERKGRTKKGKGRQ